LDLKLLEWVQSPLKACRDKALRCVTEPAWRTKLRESKDRTTARMFFGSSKATAAWPWPANGKLSPNRSRGHTLSLLTIFGIVIGETRQKQVF
jgi:hypothetical protein